MHVKNFTMVAVPEAATRVAMLERGEADIVYGVPGELIDRVKKNTKLMLAPVLSGSFWLEFVGFQDPKSPFHDKRVRQAVSLAIDRAAINDAEAAGLGKISGNWINNDVQYGLEWPEFEHNLDKARAADEGGRPSQWLRRRLADAARAVLLHAASASCRSCRRSASGPSCRSWSAASSCSGLQAGKQQWPGVQIIMHGARIGGTWSNWYESFFKCGGFNSADRDLRGGT